MLIHIDDRGYCLDHTDGVYSAGCRQFTRQEALDHWGSPDYLNPIRGQGFVDAIERDEEVSAISDHLHLIILPGSAILPDAISLPEDWRWLALKGGATLPASIALPKRLRWLDLEGRATLPRDIKLPEGIRRIRMYEHASLPAGITLPTRLKEIRLYQHATLPNNIELPAGCSIKDRRANRN